jgi:hypothetical protein
MKEKKRDQENVKRSERLKEAEKKMMKLDTGQTKSLAGEKT